jgi:peptidoglycan hydrolase-like protein with peptidoglycan-binding domain
VPVRKTNADEELILSEVSSKVYPSLDRKPGESNWVDQAGGLPSYIERIAKHLHYESGHPIGTAIAIAVGTVKRWAQGRGNNNSKLKPQTVAKAAKAVAEWEAKKAKSHAKTAAKKAAKSVKEAETEETITADELLSVGRAMQARLTVVEGLLLSVQGKEVRGRAGAVKSARALLEADGKDFKIEIGGGDANLDEMIDARIKLSQEASELRSISEAAMPRAAKGDTGGQVLHAQNRLNTLGYKVKPDGEFGSVTETAVKSFQTDHKMESDGVIGPDTTVALRGADPEDAARRRSEREAPEAMEEKKASSSEAMELDEYELDEEEITEMNHADMKHGEKIAALLEEEHETEDKAEGAAEPAEDSPADNMEDETEGETEESEAKMMEKSPADMAADKMPGVPAEGSAADNAKDEKQMAEGEPMDSKQRDLMMGAGVGGENGDKQVSDMQSLLDSSGYKVGDAGVDGRFGPDTAKALKKMQRKQGLKADGVFGAQSRRLLTRVAKRAATKSQESGKLKEANLEPMRLSQLADTLLGQDVSEFVEANASSNRTVAVFNDLNRQVNEARSARIKAQKSGDREDYALWLGRERYFETALAEADLLEAYMGWEKLVEKLMSQGKSRAVAEKIAASIGRKKYGKAKFQKAAAAGQKLKEAEAKGDMPSYGAGGSSRVCPECGMKLTKKNLAESHCGSGHSLKKMMEAGGPPNLRAADGEKSCGSCVYFDGESRCEAFKVPTDAGMVCDEWGDEQSLLNEASIGARGLIRKIFRLPDGTFAPRGRGRVLHPGETVSLSNMQGGSRSPHAVVQRDGHSIKVIDGPLRGGVYDLKSPRNTPAPATPGHLSVDKDGKLRVDTDPAAALAQTPMPKPKPQTPGGSTFGKKDQALVLGPFHPARKKAAKAWDAWGEARMGNDPEKEAAAASRYAAALDQVAMAEHGANYKSAPQSPGGTSNKPPLAVQVRERGIDSTPSELADDLHDLVPDASEEDKAYWESLAVAPEESEAYLQAQITLSDLIANVWMVKPVPQTPGGLDFDEDPSDQAMLNADALNQDRWNKALHSPLMKRIEAQDVAIESGGAYDAVIDPAELDKLVGGQLDYLFDNSRGSGHSFNFRQQIAQEIKRREGEDKSYDGADYDRYKPVGADGLVDLALMADRFGFEPPKAPQTPGNTTITVPEGIIRPEVELFGEDGNAFAILGRVKKALKSAGNDQSVVDAYMEQAMAGDYDHLLAVTLAFSDDAPQAPQTPGNNAQGMPPLSPQEMKSQGMAGPEYEKYMKDSEARATDMTNNPEKYDGEGNLIEPPQSPGYEPEYDDYVISPAGALGGRYAVSVSGKQLGEFVEYDDAIAAIDADKEKNQYFPDTFFVNDHGNIDLIGQGGSMVTPPQSPGYKTRQMGRLSNDKLAAGNTVSVNPNFSYEWEGVYDDATDKPYAKDYVFTVASVEPGKEPGESFWDEEKRENYTEMWDVDSVQLKDKNGNLVHYFGEPMMFSESGLRNEPPAPQTSGYETFELGSPTPQKGGTFVSGGDAPLESINIVKMLADMGDSVLEQAETYYDTFDETDLNPNAVAAFKKWQESNYGWNGNELDDQEAADLVRRARDYRGLGWAVQEQLVSILDGEPLEDQNPNALELIQKFVDKQSSDADNLDYGWDEIAADIEIYLKSLRVKQPPQSPGDTGEETFNSAGTALRFAESDRDRAATELDMAQKRAASKSKPSENDIVDIANAKLQLMVAEENVANATEMMNSLMKQAR